MSFISDSNFSFKLCGQPLSIKRLFFNLNDTSLNVASEASKDSLTKVKCVYLKVSICLKCVFTSRTVFSLNLVLMYTTVSQSIVSECLVFRP